MGSPGWNDPGTRGAAFAVDGHEIEAVIAAVPKGEAMQAQTINNGSAEHRIKEALAEVEVNEHHPAAWQKIVAAIGFLITIGMLVWMLFK